FVDLVQGELFEVLDQGGEVLGHQLPDALAFPAAATTLAGSALLGLGVRRRPRRPAVNEDAMKGPAQHAVRGRLGAL
ncbi:MAG: hypothetical protein D6696_07805, partial [Acidobacteria bacterium]